MAGRPVFCFPTLQYWCNGDNNEICPFRSWSEAEYIEHRKVVHGIRIPPPPYVIPDDYPIGRFTRKGISWSIEAYRKLDRG